MSLNESIVEVAARTMQVLVIRPDGIIQDLRNQPPP